MVKCGESCFSVVIILLTLLIVAWIPQVRVSAVKGPREDDLQIFFYSDAMDTYSSLLAGDIDMVAGMGWSHALISPELVDSEGLVYGPVYQDAITRPSVVLAPVCANNMYQFDLNNNYTIPSYPTVRSPTNCKEFRQALAFLCDKDLYVDTYCGGFANRIDQPITYQSQGWTNNSYAGVNYPYEYDPAAASALLDANGWVQGSTPNPDYDAAFPGSAANIRVYPPGYTPETTDLDPLRVYVRTDEWKRLQAGRDLYCNMRKIGIPVDALEGPASFMTDPVMRLRDYHVYTGSWTVGRFPTYTYFLYHTDFARRLGSGTGYNYVHGFDPGTVPNHPLLNALLTQLYYATDFSSAAAASQMAMGVFTEECVTIPLWSDLSYAAYNAELLGVVNMDCYGAVNPYTFMHAYKMDGSPLRLGLVIPPSSLNIMYASWMYDYTILDRLNTYGSLDVNPYNFAQDQPGFILDWFTDTWNDLGTVKTKVMKELRQDNYFVEPVTGDLLANVDVDAYLFSNYVCYALGVDAWHWDTVKDIKRFDKQSDYMTEIYYDAASYWFTYTASPPILPFSVWLNTSYGLTENLIDTFVVNVNLTTPGFLGLAQPVWINSIESNLGEPFTEFVDYHWEQGDWYISRPLLPGTIITVDYYALDDPSGYYPSNNTELDMTAGCGMYYLTDYVPGAGGYLIAKKNPSYWMDTPYLAEIDYKWEAGGYYEVTIFDVVKAAGAYDSQGTGVPDFNWFPGADLAAPGGQIDIFDIVTIAVHYGGIMRAQG
jgi:ABC-type transport system substrate-binding protein